MDLGRCLTPPSQHTDWTKVHRQAYIDALATEKARQLLKKLKKNRCVDDLFSNMFTQSFTYSYFAQKDSKCKKPARKQTTKALIGGHDIYKYYPTRPKPKPDLVSSMKD